MKNEKLLQKTNIVGVIASRRGMRMAQENPDCAHIYEWRVDCEPDDWIGASLQLLGKPFIVTVRCKSEGGTMPWSNDERAELYLKHMPMATFIDVESSTADHLKDVVAIAKEQGVGVIISYHHFNESPPFEFALFEDLLKFHKQFGGDIFKIAVKTDGLRDLEMLIACVNYAREMTDVKIAPMGMGKYGKVSRLLFGLVRTPLIYGYLDAARASGQLHVSKLRSMLADVRE